jgi:hypothetical protein
VDALVGNGNGTSAADAPLPAEWLRCRLGWWSGGSGVPDTGQVGGGEGVGQAAQ